MAHATWHGKRLRRATGLFDANFYDIDTDDDYWLSGPHRNGSDTRYSNIHATVDEDARTAYEAFLAGAPLPGREQG